MEETKAQKAKKMRLERTSKGLCDRCGKPAEEGLHRCNKCGITHRVKERNRKGNKSWKQSGKGQVWRYQGE